MDLVGAEGLDLGRGNGSAEDSEYRACMEAARHHRRDEFGGHTFHHLVGCGDTGEEGAPTAAGDFSGNEGGRQDCGARMGQHAERIPLAARQDHFGIDESRAGFGELGTAAQDGRDTGAARLLLLHQLEGLLAGWHRMGHQR